MSKNILDASKVGGAVVVEWVDSSLQNSQVGKGEYPKPELIVSVGWLVERTKKHLTIARDDMKDSEFRGLLCIPTECVRSEK